MDGRHICLGENCNTPITWTFAICANCEKIYGQSPYEWPVWLRFYWQDVQRERRRDKKIGQYEMSFSDMETAEEINGDE